MYHYNNNDNIIGRFYPFDLHGQKVEDFIKELEEYKNIANKMKKTAKIREVTTDDYNIDGQITGSSTTFEVYY